MTDPTGYTIRETVRARDDLVTYVVCDLAGVVRSVTVPFDQSVPWLVDPIIRHAIANTPVTGRLSS